MTKRELICSRFPGVKGEARIADRRWRHVLATGLAASLLAACGGGDLSEDARRDPLAVTTNAVPAYDRDDLYRFFAIAFGAAPGVTYMGQLVEAAEVGRMSIKEIVNVFTTKSQFLETYPASLTNQEYAQRLVDNVVGTSANAVARSEAVADIVEALKLPNWTRGDITYAIFNNLAKKPADDAKWAGTAMKMANQVAYAKHYTETMKVDTTDLIQLRAVVKSVTESSPTNGVELGALIQTAVQAALAQSRDTVSVATSANVTALGAVSIDAGISGYEAYDLVASVGDSWRLLVNPTTKKARIKVLRSDYGLSGESADEDVDITISGTTTTVMSKTGSSINVVVDTRTKSVTGEMTVTNGSTSKKSSVSGTQFSVSSLAAVAGDYVFAGKTTCYQGNSTNAAKCTDTPNGVDTFAGTLRVRSDGVFFVCDSAIIDTDTNCLDPSENTKTPPLVLKSAVENGITVLKFNSGVFGRLQVIPGDLGTALLLDVGGMSPGGQFVNYSTGVIAARKLAPFQGTEFNGNWLCIKDDGTKPSFTVSGITATATVGGSEGASLIYNKVWGPTPEKTLNVPGLISTYSGNQGPFDIIIAMSSTLAYLIQIEDINSAKTLSVCRRTN